MHIVFRESHSLEETATPVDVGQDPADLVVLSYSDSDLGAFLAGWKRAADRMPTTRLANLIALRHPLSLDTYVERTLINVRGILVRVIGGEAYWPHGLATLNHLARTRGIALAVLPADGRDDDRLDALSTVPVATLRRLKKLCDSGGAVAAEAALIELAHAAGFDIAGSTAQTHIPDRGFYTRAAGVAETAPPQTDKSQALVSFYRSYLTAADMATVDALLEALERRGFDAYGAFAPSLKAPGVFDWLTEHLAASAPAIILNATAFSARNVDGVTPFDAVSAPAFQVALSTARRREWQASTRGLSPADLAMHVVLPEVDGRLFAGVVSFKSPSKRDPDLQFSHFAHRADQNRIDAAIDRVTAWHQLAQKPVETKQLAIILSSYPGRPHQIAHAVGLDALASADAILSDLFTAGFAVSNAPIDGNALRSATITWPVESYRSALANLPETLCQNLVDAWGDPASDSACREGNFHFAALQRGNAIVAVQPERGDSQTRDNDYHDLARTPRHVYVAFYLWLKAQRVDALIHVGAHGTLEWLPGKSVALSQECWPEALIGATPVIYPFIVNDPGEAAQAKRRIGAVTLGHVPPPLALATLPDQLVRLERLLDEYATADGLDPARRSRLIAAIRDEARAAGVERDLDIPETASAAEAIPRIDRFVCDLKESRYGDGLHIYGRGEHGAAERDGLLGALAGKRVSPGPSGSPNRGRSDVLPTGRNLYSVDPRAVPSRNAYAQGIKLAEELLRRHLQDHGDWPKGLVVDLWGSATMRTAGEDFAMAMHLAGVMPRWDNGSERIAGFEIIALAELGRPRIDVTLRVSGLFRDVFPGLAQLFETASAALAARTWEGQDENPYIAKHARVFGPRPGHYGLNMATLLQAFTPEARAAAGEAWLASSAYAIGTDGESRLDRDGIENRVRAADAFVHAQDLPETDILLAADYAAHEAGFAAARAKLGASTPALYHLDATRADAPRARLLTEEIARVVRARAANPQWLAGMMRHGFRGAAEIAATLEHMAAFAHLANVVPAHLFDLYYDATLGDAAVAGFIADANPEAWQAMQDCFAALHGSGLWQTRRNSIAAKLQVAE